MEGRALRGGAKTRGPHGANHTRPNALARSNAGARVSSRARKASIAAAKSSNATKKKKAIVLFNESLLDKPASLPPPCDGGSSRKCTTKLCFKQQTRQYKCSMPGVRPASSDDPVPFVWSRELMERQRVFRNELPFETSKFRSFASQLPRSSNMSSVLRDGLCASSDEVSECDTCAVVGASGSLLARRHGALIDAHEVVIRPNWLLTKGYESIVGTRTDLNLFFGVEGMIDQFETAQRKLPVSQRAVGLVTPASDRSIASFFRHMHRVSQNKTRPGRANVFLLADGVYHRALGTLCHATNAGCDWQRQTSRMRPSTGFFSVILALQLCRKVSLFGLTTDPCQPFHYYGAPKAECSKGLEIPKQNDESVHWFEKEHEIYENLQKEGRLTVYS